MWILTRFSWFQRARVCQFDGRVWTRLSGFLLVEIRLCVRSLSTHTRRAHTRRAQRGEIERRGMSELYIPTPDYLEPQLADIEKAVAFIEDNERRQLVTYVHCKAGKGRAPTIVLCYLMKKHAFTPLDALNFIVQRRPQVSNNVRKFCLFVVVGWGGFFFHSLTAR